MDSDRLLKIGAVAGIGMIAIGGFLYYRQRKSAALSGFGNGIDYRRHREAPIVGSYSDGNMRTQLRASANMPIEERIGTIQRKILESVQDPEMRKLALHITSKCPERDKVCEAKAIYKAVKKRIRYTGDVAGIMWPSGEVEGIDLYQSARRTWYDMKGGDCDDQSILNATLLSLNGIESVLAVTAEDALGEDSHIYANAKMNERDIIALDTTLPGKLKFGVEAPFARRKYFAA